MATPSTTVTTRTSGSPGCATARRSARQPACGTASAARRTGGRGGTSVVSATETSGEAERGQEKAGKPAARDDALAEHRPEPVRRHAEDAEHRDALGAPPGGVRSAA